MASKYTIRGTADMTQHDQSVRKSASEVYKYKTQVKNAEKEMGNLNRNLGTASTSLRNFTNSLGSGKIGSLTSSLQGLSSAFGGLGGNIGNLSTSLGAIGGNITSLINPYALLGTAVIGAGTAFFKFNENLDATTRKVQEFLGVSRDVALPIRNSMQAIADTYSVEFKDVLNSADTLMNQFGISSEEALDIVSKGFAAGANENGNFLSLLQQYAPTFRDAGISAQSLAAYIAQTRSGIFNEDGLRLITVATKNIRNMSDKTKQSLRGIGIDADNMIAKLNNGQITIGQAISTISSKLSELNPQSQQVGAVLQDVFGKKGSEAGYKLVTALKDVGDNLDREKEKTEKWGTSMDDLKKANERLNNATAEMFGTAEGGFDLLIKKAKTLGLDALSTVIEALNTVRDCLEKIGALQYVVDGLKSSFTALIPTKTIENLTTVLNLIKSVKNEIGKGNVSETGGAGASGGASGGGSRGVVEDVVVASTTGGSSGGGKKSGGKSKSKAKKVNPIKKALSGSGNKYLKDEIDLTNKLIDLNNKRIKQEKELLAKKVNSGSEDLKKEIDFKNQLIEANERRKANEEVAKQEELNNAYSNFGSILSSTATAMQAFGDSEGAQVGAIIANTMATVAQALAAGTLQALSQPFPANLAAYATIAGIIASVISQVSSLKGYAEGGIIGGNRTIGDMNLARVNSGEMILNGKQQRNLFNIINSGALGAGSDSNQTVHFRVSGNDLVGVLNNYNNKRSKAR